MGKRLIRFLGAIALLAMALTVVPAAEVPAAAAGGRHETSGSGLHGGGFLNVVAIDPFDPSIVLVGGDTSGVSRSVDGGATWRPANDGAFGHRQRRVAAIAFSPTVPGKVYLGVGAKGVDSALYVSDDHGQTWTLRSTTPRFSGANNNNVGDLPTPHPRSTGNLFAFDGPQNMLYIGSFDGGLLRSPDDGFTWETLGLADEYLRSIAQDPLNPGTLYAATWSHGVFRITDAAGGATVEALPTSPSAVEEIAAVDDLLFVATGDGIQVSDDQGASWTDLSAGLPATAGRSTSWMSIAATSGPAGVTVIAGAFTPPAADAGYAGLVRSVDGGTSWEPLGVAPGSVSTSIGGPGGDPWWYAAATPKNLLGGPWYAAAQVVVSPHDPEQVLSAGRGGLWRSSDGGDSWYPAVKGLSLTENSDVAVDPNDPNQVVVANTDWVILQSADAMAQVSQNRPPTGNEAYSLSYTNDRLYVAVGNRDHVDRDGEVYSTDDVADPTAWVTEGLAAATGGQRPIGVAAFDDAVDGRIVLAAVAESGVWRKQGGDWSHLGTPAVSGRQATHRAVFHVASSSRLVYLFDRGRGVWRSTDAGMSWDRVWGVTSQAVMTGDFVVAPEDPSRLYVATVDGLWRLDGADAGSVEDGSVTLTALDVADPGPVAVTTQGAVYVAARPTQQAAQLLVSDDAGVSFVDVADARYRGAAAFPISMTVAGNGDVHVTTIGNGNIVVRALPPEPDTVAPSTQVEVPEAEAVLDPGVVPFAGTAIDDVAVGSVAVAIRDRDTGSWWHSDGSWGAWATHQADLNGSGEVVDWGFDWDAATAGRYGLWARATDEAGNRDPSPSWIRFTVVDPGPDTIRPDTTVIVPGRRSTLLPPVVASGTASDDRAVASVRVAIRDRDTRLWWHADGTWGGWANHPAELVRAGATAAWSFGWEGAEPGRYVVWARATDAAGNNDASPTWVPFVVGGAQLNAGPGGR